LLNDSGLLKTALWWRVRRSPPNGLSRYVFCPIPRFCILNFEF
jgi:hypothetical protein